MYDFNNDEVIRPEFDQNPFYITDGTHNATIKNANRELRSSKFEGKGDWESASLEIDVEAPNGSIKKYYIVPLSWGSRSKWLQLLSNLGIEIEPGESFRLSSLVGTAVTVEIQNVERDGKNYSNIVTVKKRSLTVVQTPKKRMPPKRLSD